MSSVVPQAEAVPMAVAVPIQAKAEVVVPMGQPTGQHTGQPMAAHGSGRWSSSLCDCCQNCCMCFAGWCCPCFPVAQLAARTKGDPGRFGRILALMWLLWILYQGFYTFWVYGPEGYAARLQYAYFVGLEIFYNPAWWGAQYTISFLGYIGAGITLLVVSTCLLCTARKRIIQRDGIAEDGCATCCLSCCPCTQSCAMCQMMRHELQGGQYDMCHPTAAELGGPAV